MSGFGAPPAGGGGGGGWGTPPGPPGGGGGGGGAGGWGTPPGPPGGGAPGGGAPGGYPPSPGGYPPPGGAPAPGTFGGPPAPGTFGGPPAHMVPVGGQGLAFPCRFCNHPGPHRTDKRVSTAGWIVFAVMLTVCFPLFWVGLLMKEDKTLCGRCNNVLT